jgi:hypothetical protein
MALRATRPPYALVSSRGRRLTRDRGKTRIVPHEKEAIPPISSWLSGRESGVRCKSDAIIC